jgi:hypothetical protein
VREIRLLALLSAAVNRGSCKHALSSFDELRSLMRFPLTYNMGDFGMEIKIFENRL